MTDFDPNALADAVPVLRLWPDAPPTDRPFGPDDDARPRDGRPGVIDLWRVEHPALAVYLPTDVARPAAAVVVVPGGGYGMQSHTLEGLDVAKRLNANGIAAFVLRYRLPDGRIRPGELPVPQQDGLRAVQLVRHRAAEFGVDPDRVGVLGFSAGGHLAATVATLSEQAGTLAGKAGHDAASAVSARPDFAVLAYPVISLDPAVTHAGSRHNLIGENAGADLERRYSADLLVTSKTPPLFIFHARDDLAVPVANAERMKAAADRAGVPCELLVFETGGHGFGLSTPGAEAAVWAERVVVWMRDRGAGAVR